MSIAIERSRSAASPSIRGFTLVELMVAIVIMSMVFLGAFGVIRAGVNTQMYVREASDIERQGPAVLEQIAMDLHNASFYNWRENGMFFGKSLEIGGDARADQIHFITHRSSLVADSAIDEQAEILAPLAEVSYMLKPGEDGFYELCRREQPYVDDKPFEGGYFRLISNRIRSFRVQYAGESVSEEANTATDPSGTGGTGNGNNTANGRTPTNGTGDQTGTATNGEEEEDKGVVWEDEWDSAKKGCLPVAIKIELLISPDADPDIMLRMQSEKRIESLDRSYVHLVLLPQFREDLTTRRQTSSWNGQVAEPRNVGTGGAGGRRRGDGRGQGGEQGGPGGRGGRGGQNGGAPNGEAQNFLNQLSNGARPQGGSNPFFDALRQGGGTRGR